jgi:class 3 adenylate cyclase/tetratricopeptide (TPR) repeat protein
MRRWLNVRKGLKVMVSSTIERRLAVVLYADAVGYSFETNVNEVATHKALTARFQVLEETFSRRGGTIIDRPGDAMLAEFKSVSGAMVGAIEAQDALRHLNATESPRLGFRIGINLGDIIVDGGNIYGDGVNITERIQRVALPGGVCVSEAFYCALNNTLQRRFTSCGEHILKNIERPVRIYRMRLEGQLAPSNADEQILVTVAVFRAINFDQVTENLDSEETHALVTRVDRVLSAAVSKHGGSVLSETAECYVTAFGASPRHEKAALSSVLASLNFLDEIAAIATGPFRKLAWAVGIDCSLAVVERFESAPRKVYGPAVTQATAIARRAETAGVFVTADIVESIAEKCDCLQIDPADSAAEKMQIWRVIGRSKGASNRQCEFVGRQTELLQLQSIVETAITTRRGCIVQITGEAGIGKTRLADELLSRAAARSLCVKVEFDKPVGVSNSHPTTAILGAFLGLDKCTHAEEVAKSLDDALSSGLLAADQLPFVYDALDLVLPTNLRGRYSLLDDEARKVGKRHVVSQIVAETARRGPLVIALEDAHLADYAEQAFLRTLAEIAVNQPIVLLLTVRTPAAQRDRSKRLPFGDSAIFSLHLGPLAHEACVEIAAQFSISGGAPVADCINRAGGNPLFLVQLLRHLSSRSGRKIPTTIFDVIKTRLDDLPTSEKTALQCIAVAGSRISHEMLQFTIGDDYSPDYLVESGLIHRAGDEWAFSHDLIRETTYQSIAPSRRREWHRRAAEWFDGRDRLRRAEHLEMADHPLAADAFWKASADQLQRFRYAEALDLADRGLANRGADQARFNLLQLKGQILFSMGLVGSATSVIEQAIEVADHDTQRVHAWLVLAKIYIALDRYDDALRYLDVAEGAAHSNRLELELAKVHHLRGNLYFPLGRVEECHREQAKALHHARASGCLETEASTLSGLGDAEYACGRMRSSHRHFLDCVGMASERGWLRTEAENRHMVASTAHYFMPLRESHSQGMAALELAVRIAHRRAELCCHSLLSVVSFDLGKWELAEASLEQGQTLARQLGARRFEPLNLTYLAKLRRRDGDWSAARSLVTEALKTSRVVGMSYNGPRVLSELALVENDRDAGREALKEGEAILAAGCIGSNHLWFFRDAMDVGLASGDLESALFYAERLAAHTAGEPLVWAEIFVRRCRIMVDVKRNAPRQRIVQDAKRLISLAREFHYDVVAEEIESCIAGESEQRGSRKAKLELVRR